MQQCKGLEEGAKHVYQYLDRNRWIGAGAAPNTPDQLLRWLRDPDELKPGVVMPGFAFLSEQQLHALVTYLESLR